MRKYMGRQIVKTIIYPGAIDSTKGKPEIETLSPIECVGKLTDDAILKAVRKHHKEDFVFPYKVEFVKEKYEMKVTDFIEHAELKESNTTKK